MKKMSKRGRALITAYKRGYRVSVDGKRVKGIRKSSLSLQNWDGYLNFSVPFEGTRYVVNVHRLQAYQKYGEKIFEDGILVRHLNGDPQDNSWENIKIGTAYDNRMDMSKEERRRLVKNPLSKDEVLDIVSRINAGEKRKLVAIEYGLALVTISNIMAGRRHAKITGICKTETYYQPEEKILKIVERLRSMDYETYQQLAEECGVSRGIIAGIKQGKSYMHITGIKKGDIECPAPPHHLSDSDVVEIARRLEEKDYDTQGQLADEFGSSDATISKIKNGSLYTRVTGY